jgi:hypothetical protein
MWSKFLPNLSCLQNNPTENNVEPVPGKSEPPPNQSFFPVVLLCQYLVLVGNRFWFYILHICTQSTIQLWCCVNLFLIWREIVFGVTYILSVQYSCAVVSVFWLWSEIVFKMRTRFYNKILLGYFIMIR